VRFLLPRSLKFFCGAVLVALLTLHANVARADDSDLYDGKIQFVFTPYVWLPTINGTFKYNLSDIHEGLPYTGGDRTFTTSIKPNSYLSNLNFGLMGAAEVRKGKLAVYTDFMNTNIGNQAALIKNVTLPSGQSVAIDGTIHARTVATLWTVGPSLTVLQKDGTVVNVLIGGRFAWLTASEDWQLTADDGLLNKNGSAAANTNVADALIGSYGKFGLGKHWSVPYYVDAGTGTPSFTWEALLGVKYGNAILAYRHLSYSGGTGVLQSMQLSGPTLGYSIKL